MILYDFICGDVCLPKLGTSSSLHPQPFLYSCSFEITNLFMDSSSCYFLLGNMWAICGLNESQTSFESPRKSWRCRTKWSSYDRCLNCREWCSNLWETDAEKAGTWQCWYIWWCHVFFWVLWPDPSKSTGWSQEKTSMLLLHSYIPTYPMMECSPSGPSWTCTGFVSGQ